MIVCLCKVVRDRDIQAHVARGARTVRDLGRACGAGTDCGSCVCDLRAQLSDLVGTTRQEEGESERTLAAK